MKSSRATISQSKRSALARELCKISLGFRRDIRETLRRKYSRQEGSSNSFLANFSMSFLRFEKLHFSFINPLIHRQFQFNSRAMNFKNVSCLLLYLWHFLFYTLMLLISLYYKICKFLTYISSCYATVRDYSSPYIIDGARYFYVMFL